MSLLVYFGASAILELLLAIIWKTSNWPNTFLKLVLFVLAAWSVYFFFTILPRLP